MLERINDLPNGVVGLKASGTVTEEDYEKVFLPLVETAHQKGDRIRLLYHLTPEFEAFTMGAAWQDARLGFKHLRLFVRCALVTDQEWLRKISGFFSGLFPCEVETFKESEFTKAIDWVAATPREKISHTLLGDKGVLLINPDGPLNKVDFDTIAQTVDPWIEQKGSLNGIVIHTKKFPGWDDFGSLIRHYQFVRDHHRNVKRVGLAADGNIPELAEALVKHFVEADLKHFDFDEQKDAIKWACGD